MRNKITFERTKFKDMLPGLLALAQKPDDSVVHFTQGILFEFLEDGLDIVATDGHAMTCLSFTLNIGDEAEPSGYRAGAEPTNVLLVKRCALATFKAALALSKEKAPVELELQRDGTYSFSIGDARVSDTELGCEFPETWRGIIEARQEGNLATHLSVDLLARACAFGEGVARFTDKATDPVHITYEHNSHARSVVMPVKDTQEQPNAD